MRHVLEALVQYKDPTEEYQVRCTPHSNGAQLLIEVEWDNRRHGKDVAYRVQFELDEAHDAAEAVRWVMRASFDSCTSLEAKAGSEVADCHSLQQAAESDDKLLEEYANKKEELDGDIALKAAALLAAKQEYLTELLQQAETNTLTH